jgi:hypothetical protein
MAKKRICLKLNLRNVSLVLILLVAVVFFLNFSAAIPFGSNVTSFSNETAPVSTPDSYAAIAGNVTEINLNGTSVTQSWQGYFGNVTGTIVLGDGSNNQLYNWSDASPKGEVYASVNDSINWYGVQCFNFSAAGTFADDSANIGGTSQFGLNLTQLEAQYNIPYDVSDSVNNTFPLSGAGNHVTFYTGHLQFTDGTCQSTRLFSNSGQSTPGQFEEVLLYDYTSRSPIFTSILNQDLLGFDGRSHDFEMLVLDDGHGTDTVTTPYYFYVELQ